MRDAGLSQGWDLQGSPESTRDLYFDAIRGDQSVASSNTAFAVFDARLMQNNDVVAPLPQFTLHSSSDENPFGHEMTLG